MSRSEKYVLLKFVVIVCLLVCINGCGDSDKPKYTPEELEQIPMSSRDGLPPVSGGFVLSVSGKAITADEVVEPLIERFREPARRSDLKTFRKYASGYVEAFVVNKISDILLYSKAKDSLGNNLDDVLDKEVEKEVKRFVGSFGGDWAEAERTLRKDGMTWADFRKYQKRMIISQSYIASKLPQPKKVTYSELLDYYNAVKADYFAVPAKLQFQLIDIQPAKMELSEPNDDALQSAGNLARDLVKRLKAGEDFAELAKKYSHGHRKIYGGLWKPVQPQSLAKPYDVLAESAEKLEPGQIDGPIEAGGHIFIMKLKEKERQGFRPFDEVHKQIEAKMFFDRRKEAVDELMASLAREARVARKDEFIDFCVCRIYQICTGRRLES